MAAHRNRQGVVVVRLTATCGLCDYTVEANTESDAAAALFAHLRTVHPDKIGANS